MTGGEQVSASSLIWNKRSTGIVILILIVGAFLGDRILNGSQGDRFHQKLLHEFSLLEPMHGAVVKATKDNYSRYNSRKALVGANYYVANTGYDEIFKYYDRELAAQGWNRVSESHSLVWGRDLGGREAHYCKGPLAATLQYAGSDRSQAWTYAIDLSWGLSNCQ